MRIMKSKAADPTYHVIQDVKRDGKRSTEIIENLEHASEICSKYNVSDADIGADEYIKNLRNSAKSKEHKVLIHFVTNSVIEKINPYLLTPATFFFRKFTTSLDYLLYARKSKRIILSLMTLMLSFQDLFMAGFFFLLQNCRAMNSQRNF